MTQEEILEGNKLIAEFIYDDSFIDDGDGDCYCESPNGMIDFYIEDAKYDSSWDWLMPVLKKIEKEYWITTTTRRGISAVSIHQPKRAYEEIARFDSEDKLEATWRVVVEFIKRYNENIKNNKNERL